VIFRPGLTVLRSLLDKYDQRQFFQQHGLPTPMFQSPAPAAPPSFPTVLKTRRMGYDGQGTFIPKTLVEYQAIVDRIGAENLLWEEFVPFDRELAVVVARSGQGEIVVYPIVETQQVDQVCHWVIAPAAVADAVAQQIQTIAPTILEKLDVVGIFGIELFITADDRVLVNEIAPRTHNSGHYSLDACHTSQFEQQLRAVADLPLGDPDMNCAGAIMVNLLGFESATTDYQAQRDALAAIPNAHVHWYGKTASRPGRKLGHVTVKLFGNDWRSRAQASIEQVTAIWYPGNPA
jgi:5-(carboxyamino)imidazole ribonucleotide synthase